MFKSANDTPTTALTLQGETYFSGDRVASLHVSESVLVGLTAITTATS